MARPSGGDLVVVLVAIAIVVAVESPQNDCTISEESMRVLVEKLHYLDHHWEKFGFELEDELPIGKLEEIKQTPECRSEVSNCMRKVLYAWRDNTPGPLPFAKVNNTLFTIGYARVATDVYKLICLLKSADQKPGIVPTPDQEPGIVPTPSGNETVEDQIDHLHTNFVQLVNMVYGHCASNLPLHEIKVAITLLPVPMKARHASFLQKDNLKYIADAETIDQIFIYMNSYWNFFDYEQLE